MTALTRRQHAALSCIEGYLAEHLHAPTIRTLGSRLNIGAGAAHRLVVELERRGAVTRDRHRHNGIAIVRDVHSRLDFLPPDIAIQVHELAVLAKCPDTDVVAEAVRDGIRMFREHSRKRRENVSRDELSSPPIPAEAA